MSIGARVRLLRPVGGGESPGTMYGRIDAGTCGTVVEIDADADAEMGEPIAFIKLDEPREDLAEWHNILHVWAGGSAADVTLDDLALIF